MVRADNKQDSDQPHFYSQYWIDVASGKPSATMSSATSEIEEEEEDLDDLSFAQPEIVTKPKATKPAEKKPDAAHSTLTSFADLANIDLLMKNSAEMDDTMMPDITAGLDAEDLDVGYDLVPEAEEPEEAVAQEEEFPFDEDEEEEDEWGDSRRKKGGKPKRREHREY